MTSGVMEITTKIGCSINCKYCPQQLLIREYNKEGKDKKPKYMSFEVFQTCIDKIPKEVAIDFAGMCEPWLNPECTKMLKYAVKKGHRVKIYTTLVGMKESDLEEIEKLPIEEFVLHIADESENSKIPVTTEYKKMLSKLMNIKFSCPIRLSCHSQIHKEIKEIITKDWGKPDDEMNDRAGNLEIQQISHQEISDRIACRVSGEDLNRNILLPDGTVLLCCMDYGMNHIMGNLLTQDYKSLFESECYKRVTKGLREKGEDILCRKCVNAHNIDWIISKYASGFEELEKVWAGRVWIEKQYKEQKRWTEEQEKSKEYLIGRIEELEKQVVEQKEWAEELEKAKEYLIGRIEELEKQVVEQKEWTEELEKAKEYLIGRIEELEKQVVEQKKRAEELEKAKEYLIGRIEELEKQVVEQKEWGEELEKAKKYLDGKIEELEKQVVEQKNWIEQVEEAKTYWNETANILQKELAEQKDWEKQLEDSKNWYAEQLKGYEKGKLEFIEQLRQKNDWIEQLEKAKLWLEEQIENYKKDNKQLLYQIEKEKENQTVESQKYKGQINQLTEKNEELDRVLEDMTNQISKLNYKIAKLKSDKMIAKIIQLKKYDV